MKDCPVFCPLYWVWLPLSCYYWFVPAVFPNCFLSAHYLMCTCCLPISLVISSLTDVHFPAPCFQVFCFPSSFTSPASKVLHLGPHSVCYTDVLWHLVTVERKNPFWQEETGSLKFLKAERPLFPQVDIQFTLIVTVTMEADILLMMSIYCRAPSVF